MQSTHPQERPRRTQQERRDSTRRVLLDATISCLVDLGYAGTTTLEVERRAGVSRGARIHHFPTKAALLASAVDYLYDRLSDHYELAFGQTQGPAPDAARFHSGLRMLWSIYRRPEYSAVLELNIAARTDAELRERLGAVAERHRALAIEAASCYFPRIAPIEARALIEAIHAALGGLLLHRNIHAEQECALCEELVLGLLDELVAVRLQNDPPASSSGGERKE